MEVNLNLINDDCMSVMRDYPDNYFDLAIVDPPYGIGESGKTNKSRRKLAIAKDYKPFAGGDISAPNSDYFAELKRVSKNQIIWGANHFCSVFGGSSSCWIVWDKINGSSDFADCELAYSSFGSAVRQFKFQWAGMLQGDMKNKEHRIHPTQKPVKLYQWLYDNYSKQGQKILDTHLGSGSNAIAAYYAQMGEFVGVELDADYFNLAEARIKQETKQVDMFAGVSMGDGSNGDQA